LTKAGLVKVNNNGTFLLTEKGDPLLDKYMAWLGLNNRGGV
jgi:predicted transcriptional regulator